MLNPIEEIIEKGYAAVQNLPPWGQFILVLVVILISQGPKLLALRARWYDYRLNRNRLQFEKELLENLKLHYEIEAIKKSNSLHTDEYETELLRECQESTNNIMKLHLPEQLPNLLAKLDSHITQKKLWRWVTNYPRLGKIVINILYVFITLYAYMFALAAVSMIAVSFSVQDFRTEVGGTWPVLAINLVYIFITALFFYWKKIFAHYQAEVVRMQEDSGSAD